VEVVLSKVYPLTRPSCASSATTMAMACVQNKLGQSEVMDMYV